MNEFNEATQTLTITDKATAFKLRWVALAKADPKHDDRPVTHYLHAYDGSVIGFDGMRIHRADSLLAVPDGSYLVTSSRMTKVVMERVHDTVVTGFKGMLDRAWGLSEAAGYKVSAMIEHDWAYPQDPKDITKHQMYLWNTLLWINEVLQNDYGIQPRYIQDAVKYFGFSEATRYDDPVDLRPQLLMLRNEKEMCQVVLAPFRNGR